MLITLQESGERDIPEIAALNIRLQIDEGSEPMSHEAVVSRLSAWLSGGYRCRFFLLDAVRVGYVLFRATDHASEGHPGGVFIRQFMIAPAHRRRGIGTAAFHRFRQEVGVGAPILLEVIAGNPGAQRFWESLGFSQYLTRYRLAADAGAATE